MSAERTGTRTVFETRRPVVVLRRRWWVIAFCFVIATGAAFGLSKLQTKQYTATATLLFKNQGVAQQASGLAATPVSDPIGQRATNLLVVQDSMGVANRAAASVGNGVTANQIRSAITVTQPGDANVVSISATSTRRLRAARIANAYAKAFVVQQQLNDQTMVQHAIDLLHQQQHQLTPAEVRADPGVTLRSRLESLRILKSMQINTQVIQAAAVPTAPSSPTVGRNTVLGALLGLVIGLLLAFRLDQMDQRLRDVDEVEEAFGLPMLSVVPHYESRQMRDRPTALRVEPFRMLRAHLRYFNVDRPLRILLITSAEAQEGKTTVASGLAEAAADMGSRTLLIEADLRRPVLINRYGLKPGPGLTGALVSPDQLGEAAQRIDATATTQTEVDTRRNGNAADGRVLDVITAGAVPPNPTELLESHAMQHVLAWAKENYELVIVDSAPLTLVPDAIPLLEQVDGVIVVSRLGRSTRSASERLRQQLENLHAPTLGLAINDLRSGTAGYGYGYGYEPYEDVEDQAFVPAPRAGLADPGVSLSAGPAGADQPSVSASGQPETPSASATPAVATRDPAGGEGLTAAAFNGEPRGEVAVAPLRSDAGANGRTSGASNGPGGGQPTAARWMRQVSTALAAGRRGLRRRRAR
jgi:succinoglycan biosynthesis transport protein ExoP